MSTHPTAPTISLNGRPEALRATSLAELVGSLGLPSGGKGVAVALNGAVVPRARWPLTALSPGDEVEVVRAISGG